MTTDQLQQIFADKRVAFITRKAERDVLKRQTDELRQKIDSYHYAVSTFRKVGVIFQALSDEESSKFQSNLKRLVTAGLQVVFEEQLEFDMEITVERNVMAVNFYVISIVNQVKLRLDILSAKGGGVADVVSFLLQFLLVYYLPNRRRIMIVDEGWKNLSRDYKSRFAEFVKAICVKAGVQIIMVTHDEEYVHVADKVYRFSLNDRGLTDVAIIR